MQLHWFPEIMPDKKTRKITTHFTFDERVVIQELVEKGFPGAHIGFILGRDCGTINRELRVNGGRENYKAVDAHNNHNVRRKNKNDKTSKTLLNLSVSSDRYTKSLLTRVEDLEMQIEILTDTIQGLTK